MGRRTTRDAALEAVRYIQVADEDAEIEPVTPEGGGQKPEPEMDRLSNIINEFNDRFGGMEWQDRGRHYRSQSSVLACTDEPANWAGRGSLLTDGPGRRSWR